MSEKPLNAKQYSPFPRVECVCHFERKEDISVCRFRKWDVRVFERVPVRQWLQTRNGGCSGTPLDSRTISRQTKRCQTKNVVWNLRAERKGPRNTNCLLNSLSVIYGSGKPWFKSQSWSGNLDLRVVLFHFEKPLLIKMHANTYTYTYNTHTCTHTHMRTCLHTHSHTPTPPWPPPYMQSCSHRIFYSLWNRISRRGMIVLHWPQTVRSVLSE